MKLRHKRHLSHHQPDGGEIPPFLEDASGAYKHGGKAHHHKGHHVPHHLRHRHHKAKGGSIFDPKDEEGGKREGTDHDPDLVSGNKVVVAAAKEKKSIGEVPGIYARKRLDRKARTGGYDGASLVKKVDGAHG